MSVGAPREAPSAAAWSAPLARAWWIAVAALVVVLGICFADTLAGRTSVDGAALLPYQDPVYATGSLRAMPEEPGDTSPQLSDQPWDTFIVRTLARGRLPLWMPYNGFGYPQLADGQSAPFNPLKLVLWGGAWGYAQQIFLISRLALAMAGALLLARRLGLGPWGGALAGLAFGLGGFFAYHLRFPETHVMAFLPWLLLAGEALAERPGVRTSAIFGLAIGLTGLLGHGEVAVFVAFAGCVACLAGVLARRDGKVAGVGAIAAGGLVGVLVAGIVVLPFLEFVHVGLNYQHDIRHSAMAVWNGVWTVPALLGALCRHLVQMDARPAPYFYNAGIGVVALAFVPLGLLRPGARRLPLALAAATALIFVVCGPVGALPIRPVLNSFYASGVLALALALLAGGGLELALTRPRLVLPWSAMVGIAGAALLVANLAGWCALGVGGAAIALPLAGAVCMAEMRGWPRAFIGTLSFALAAGELVVGMRGAAPPKAPFNYPLPAIVARVKADPGGYRLSGARLAFLPSTNIIHEVDVLEQLEFMHIHRVVSFFGALDGPQPINTCYGLAPTFVPDLLDQTAVRYILVPAPRMAHYPLVDATGPDPADNMAAALAHDPARYPVIATEGALTLYENRTVRPHAEVYYAVDVVAPDEDAAARRLAATPARWQHTALVEAASGEVPDAGTPLPPTAAKLLGGPPNELAVAAHADRAGWLVLRDAFYPGWHAFVDGREAPIYPAFVAFRAVPLAAGEHRVEFRFEPASVRTGAAMSLLGLLLVILAVGRPTKK